MNNIVSKNEVKELKQNNYVVTPPHAFFTISFSLGPFWDLQYKTGNLLTSYDSFFSQDMPRATFYIFSIL